MDKLTRREYKVLCEIFKAREQTLRKTMELLVKRYYPEDQVIATKDFVYAWGDIPIGLVAHLDTVHRTLPREIFHDQEQDVIWSPEGIGADDRAGVYAIFSLLQEGYRPTVIFCTQEERGGLGAEKLIEMIAKPKSPLNFLVELDRRGINDMVFYDCANDDFEDYIETFGFVKAWGSFSDISVIAPDWDVAAVNLSIGYEDEHTGVERLYVRHMMSTIGKVRRILEAEAVEEHPFEYVYGFYDYGGKYYDTSGISYEHRKCDGCEKTFDMANLTYIKDGGTWWRLCPDCLKTLTKNCKKCGRHFVPWSKEDTLCSDCRSKENT